MRHHVYTIAALASLADGSVLATNDSQAAGCESLLQLQLPATEITTAVQAGSIGYAALAGALADGYATARTDTGHVGSTADLVPDHPEKLIDFGDTPDRIEAARVRDGNIQRTRPICASPQQAVYNGSGRTDDAENFTCRTR